MIWRCAKLLTLNFLFLGNKGISPLQDSTVIESNVPDPGGQQWKIKFKKLDKNLPGITLFKKNKFSMMLKLYRKSP